MSSSSPAHSNVITKYVYAPVSGKTKAGTRASGYTSTITAAVVSLILYVLDQHVGWIHDMDDVMKGIVGLLVTGAVTGVFTAALTYWASWSARHEPTIAEAREKLAAAGQTIESKSGLDDAQVRAIWDELAEPTMKRIEQAAASTITHANAVAEQYRQFMPTGEGTASTGNGSTAAGPVEIPASPDAHGDDTPEPAPEPEPTPEPQPVPDTDPDDDTSLHA